MQTGLSPSGEKVREGLNVATIYRVAESSRSPAGSALTVQRVAYFRDYHTALTISAEHAEHVANKYGVTMASHAINRFGVLLSWRDRDFDPLHEIRLEAAQVEDEPAGGLDVLEVVAAAAIAESEVDKLRATLETLLEAMQEWNRAKMDIAIAQAEYVLTKG